MPGDVGEGAYTGEMVVKYGSDVKGFTGHATLCHEKRMQG
jgi:hypothetical protein